MGQTKELVIDGLLAALLVVLQAALAQIVNVELVSLAVMLYTLTRGKRVLSIVLVFTLMEGVLYGFGVWWLSYLYIWPLLAGLTWILKLLHAPVWGYAVLSCLFGFSFGFLCSLPYLAGGVSAMMSWWVSGIPYDILHGISNLVIALFLFRPFQKLLNLCKRLDFVNKE